MNANAADHRHQVSVETFFNGFWKAIDDMNWSAIVLHSWRDLPAIIDSDIDYAVSGPSAGELLRFLAGYSRSMGWRLVQVIEHEPGAYYCVCLQKDAPYRHLELDVTWDYRRIGHFLIRSELLFEGARRVPGKSFAIPSPGSEFCYLLAKAAAKGKAFDQVRNRLNELLHEDPQGCQQMASKTFGGIPTISEAIPAVLDSWAAWFENAPCFKAIRQGRRFGTREILLYLRRILQPTGFLLPVHQSDTDAATRRLSAVLAPIFRHIWIQGPVGFKGWPKILSQLIRTTLIIETRGHSSRALDASEANAIGTVLETLAQRVERRFPSN